jgi:glycosyltransferase involved in cell wall biosynthesis
MAPAFTVVITTHNRAELLPRAVASVLAQTCTDFELIVVDDGSTDTTPAVLESLDPDPRVTVMRIANSGVSTARNIGVAAGTGTWIAFLDDDNDWEPGYLEYQLARANEAPDADVVYGSAQEYGTHGRASRIWPGSDQPVDVFGGMIDHWYLYVSATIIRRSRFERIGGFDGALTVGEDKDLFLWLALHSKFAGSDAVLVDLSTSGHARLTDRHVERMRVEFVQDRRWRGSIIGRYGNLRYARYFHHYVGRRTVRAMLLAPPDERRAVAAEAVALLARRLPWSAATIPFPMLMLAIGPARYQQLRAGYSRTARALGIRRQAPAG